MSRRLRRPSVSKGKCGFVTPRADLSPNDRAQIEKFEQYLRVKAAEKNGAPAFAVGAAIASIYPDLLQTPDEPIEA